DILLAHGLDRHGHRHIRRGCIERVALYAKDFTDFQHDDSPGACGPLLLFFPASSGTMAASPTGVLCASPASSSSVGAWPPSWPSTAAAAWTTWGSSRRRGWWRSSRKLSKTGSSVVVRGSHASIQRCSA